jgi:pyruvate kinase
VATAVAQATVEVARAIKAAAIICATTAGSTARLITRCRPDTPIVAATPLPETRRQLALVWGVRPVLIGDIRDTDELMEQTLRAVEQARLAKPGQRVVLTAGVPVGTVGSTNLIKVHTVGQPIRPAA